MALEDIAKAAGVSTATVSRVINDQPGVSSERASRVRALIKEMKYEPKRRRRSGVQLVRNARQLKGLTIALLAVGPGYQLHTSHFVRTIEGVTAAASRLGVNVIVYAVPDCRVEALPPAVRHGQVAGLLLAGDTDNEELLEFLNRFPHVWLTTHTTARTGVRVLMGNAEAGRRAAQYLMDAGHRHLCCFNPLPMLGNFRRRQESFVDHARKNGARTFVLKCPEWLHVRENDKSLHKIVPHLEAAIVQFAAMEDRPTGMFCLSDLYTACLYPVLQDVGIRPGPDLAVISCGNEHAYLMALNPIPPTIDLGVDSVARHAVEQLTRRLQFPEEDERVTLSIEPSLVESDIRPLNPRAAAPKAEGGDNNHA